MVRSERAQEKPETIAPSPSLLLRLLLPGGITAVIYLVLAALLPITLLHLPTTPAPRRWQLWISHILFSTLWTRSGSAWPYLLLISSLLLLISLIYFFTLRGLWPVEAFKQPQGLQSDRPHTLGPFLIIIGLAGIYGLLLLLQPAFFSNELFTSIMAGRMLSIYHVDPLITLPTRFPHDPFRWLISSPSSAPIYPPIWLGISSFLTGLSSQPYVTVFLFKGLALFTHLLNICLVWLILSRLAPQKRLIGTVIYAWNPLILIELAVNGHSEGLFISLLLMTILLHLQGRTWSKFVALLLLGLACSLNPLGFLLVPLYTWFEVYTTDKLKHKIWGLSWRLLFILAVVLLTGVPLWRGDTTFIAYSSLLDLQYMLNSPLDIIASPIRFSFSAFTNTLHLPPEMEPISSADILVKVSAITLFMFIYAAQFQRIQQAYMSRLRGGQQARDEIKEPEMSSLFKGWQRSLIWAIIIMVTPFWPWFIVPVLAIAALLGDEQDTLVLLLLSCCLLFTYPLQRLIPPANQIYLPALTFGIPLIYILIKSRSTERTRPLNDR